MKILLVRVQSYRLIILLLRLTWLAKIIRLNKASNVNFEQELRQNIGK
jgi:hypothetical protein